MNINDDLRHKWDLRHTGNDHPAQPCAVLADNAHLLPRQGTALDLACGLGGNALFLAKLGLRVSAWDLSPVAIHRLRAEAATRRLDIDARERDVIVNPPKSAVFDVIVVSHFLERGLATAIAGALRPDGLLYYQTFTREAVTDQGPSNPTYRLASNELLRLFAGLLVRVYREEGRLGDTSRGFRDLVQLVAQRPA